VRRLLQDLLSTGGKVEIHERGALHEPSWGNSLGFNRDRRRQYAITAKMRAQQLDVITPFSNGTI